MNNYNDGWAFLHPGSVKIKILGGSEERWIVLAWLRQQNTAMIEHYRPMIEHYNTSTRGSLEHWGYPGDGHCMGECSSTKVSTGQVLDVVSVLGITLYIREPVKQAEAMELRGCACSKWKDWINSLPFFSPPFCSNILEASAFRRLCV